MRKSGIHDILENKIIVKVEGFSCHRLVSECLSRKIPVQDIRYLDDMELLLTVPAAQYKQFQNLTRNRFIVTEIKKKGLKSFLSQIFSRKSFLVGFGLFLFLLLYREQFLSEVYVSGLKEIPKNEFYQMLENNGLYVGGRASIDTQELKNAIYREVGGQINWVGIKIKGTKAEVEIVEREPNKAQFDYKLPCDIVAKKDGYIMKYVAKNGNSLVREGQSVTKGQTLITGARTIGAEENVPPSGSASGAAVKTEKFHAIGDFYARVIYHFNVNQERYEIIKTETGRDFYGVRLRFGDFTWNSYHLYSGFAFDRATEHRYTLLNLRLGQNTEETNAKAGLFKLFGGGTGTPIVIELIDYKEITAEKRERTKEEIAVHMKKIIRDKLKLEMPKSAIILKQELHYDATPGTVKVTVDLQTMEQIGVEKAI